MHIFLVYIILSNTVYFMNKFFMNKLFITQQEMIIN